MSKHSGDLISRSALIEDIQAAVEHGGMGALVAGSLKRYVLRCPAVDAVEVVRCRYCKHWDKEPDEREGCCFGIADGTMLTEPDEFCSRGERRADDD